MSRGAWFQPLCPSAPLLLRSPSPSPEEQPSLFLLRRRRRRMVGNRLSFDDGSRIGAGHIARVLFANNLCRRFYGARHPRKSVASIVTVAGDEVYQSVL